MEKPGACEKHFAIADSRFNCFLLDQGSLPQNSSSFLSKSFTVTNSTSPR